MTVWKKRVVITRGDVDRKRNRLPCHWVAAFRRWIRARYSMCQLIGLAMLPALLVTSCATGGYRTGAAIEPACAADGPQREYARILGEYRSLPEEDREAQLIYFCYVLRSVYESKATAPEDRWPSIRDAVGPVILDLLEGSEEIRDEVFYVGPAVKMVAPLKLESAIPILREMMDSKDVYLGRLAIDALGRLGDTESMPEIRKKLEPKARAGHFGGGTDMTTPQYAAAALWRLGDSEGAAILNDLLVHPAQGVRVQSAIALAEMGDATGIRVLESRLQNPGAFRIPVLEALSYIDHPRAEQLLEREMNVGDMRGRLLAALYLAEKGSLSGRRFLLTTAQGSNVEDAYMAAMYLARLDDQAAVRLLESLYDRVDIEKRLAAASALAWMGSGEGKEDLVEGLSDDVWCYRAIAATMLLLLEGCPADTE